MRLRFARNDTGERLQELLTYYSEEVHYPNVSGFEILELLDVRSEIAEKEEELILEERHKLKLADETFLRNVAKFYASVAEVANLAEMRETANVPPSHWWWYMEKLVQREKVTF